MSNSCAYSPRPNSPKVVSLRNPARAPRNMVSKTLRFTYVTSNLRKLTNLISQLYWGKQVTDQDNTTSAADEEESSQLYNLANSIIKECKDVAPLSDLDTAIFLFDEA